MERVVRGEEVAIGKAGKPVARLVPYREDRSPRGLLWWSANDTALGAEARARISDPNAAVYVSAATVWGISLKKALGKLKAPSDLLYRIGPNRFEALSVTASPAQAAGAPPRHHDDPFDRMLGAQAMQEGLTLLTRDPRVGIPAASP